MWCRVDARSRGVPASLAAPSLHASSRCPSASADCTSLRGSVSASAARPSCNSSRQLTNPSLALPDPKLRNGLLFNLSRRGALRWDVKQCYSINRTQKPVLVSADTCNLHMSAWHTISRCLCVGYSIYLYLKDSSPYLQESFWKKTNAQQVGQRFQRLPFANATLCMQPRKSLRQKATASSLKPAETSISFDPAGVVAGWVDRARPLGPEPWTVFRVRFLPRVRAYERNSPGAGQGLREKLSRARCFRRHPKRLCGSHS